MAMIVLRVLLIRNKEIPFDGTHKVISGFYICKLVMKFRLAKFLEASIVLYQRGGVYMLNAHYITFVFLYFFFFCNLDPINFVLIFLYYEFIYEIKRVFEIFVVLLFEGVSMNLMIWRHGSYFFMSAFSSFNLLTLE